jgi:hypothetical protein
LQFLIKRGSIVNNNKLPITIQTIQHLWNSTFVTSCLLCLSLGINYAALAEYKKPSTTQNDAPQGESTTITGIRGGGSCSEGATTKLTALAPYSHTGHSVSQHPTFAWYVPDTGSYPVQFRLYEYDTASQNAKGKNIVKETLSSSKGIMTYTLPSNLSPLTVGKTYIWQVVVICNPNSPSQSLMVSSEMKIVNAPPEIATQLNNTKDRAIASDLYAKAGIWYDALAQVVNMPNNPQTQSLTTQLIEQLAAIEQPHSSGNSGTKTEIVEIQKQHQQQLTEIIQVLKPN